MINNSQKVFICCLTAIILLAGVLSVSAQNGAQAVNEAKSFIDGIVSYKLNESGNYDIQELIDESLTQNAGYSEWYIIGLSQYDNYNFTAYETALLKYLSENKVASASSRQKYALALIATGSTNSYIYSTLNDSIGKQGVMSWIFGLHLLNNSYKSNDYTSAAVIEKLLSLQLSDGGWAISGSVSDVDTTAMAVQALAPCYKTDTTVKSAVDKALTLLSDRQNDSGDYSSYGVSNPESTSQVLLALSSLGIDAANDSRFIKNGNTVFDGIGLYRLSDGSFCHKQGGGSNGTATVQVFYSMVSYIRMSNGKTPLYIFDAKNPSGLNTPDNTDSKTSDNNIASEKSTDSDKSGVGATKVEGNEASVSSSASMTDTDKDGSYNQTDNAEIFAYTQNDGESDLNSDKIADESASESADVSVGEQGNVGGYKLWACLIIAVISGGICIILYFAKRRNIHNFMVIGIVAAVSVVLVLVTDIQSRDNYYNSAAKAKTDCIGTVTLTIRCDTVADKGAEHIPDSGIILDTAEFQIEDGDTVYDILLQAAAKNGIHLEKSGSSQTAYIKGIGNIYEFDFGDLSGWMYFVNGESPSVGCGEYILNDGDRIEWLYTCSLGEDLE